jgi:hypothetical protein
MNECKSIPSLFLHCFTSFISTSKFASSRYSLWQLCFTIDYGTNNLLSVDEEKSRRKGEKGGKISYVVMGGK